MRKFLLFWYMAMLPLFMSAERIQIDGIWYHLSSKWMQAEVTHPLEGETYEGRIVIPKMVTYQDNNYEVVQIGNSAFTGCARLIEVEIPNSVTYIGGGAFENCSSLTQVIIPNSVKDLGYSVFFNCDKLTNVSLPNSLNFISGYMFAGCDGLTQLDIGSSIEYIGPGAFSGCKNLTKVSISNSVTIIEERAFSGCENLSQITFGNSVESIGANAFGNCRNLFQITLGNSVESIGANAFAQCPKLQSITLPKSVKYVGRYALGSILRLINYSDIDIKQVNDYESVALKINYIIDMNNPEFIQQGDFILRENNGKTYLAAYIGKDEEISLPKSINGKKYEIDSHAFTSSPIRSITIPEPITHIGKNAFSYCLNLLDITLPQSITSIEDGVFQNCSALTNINVSNSVSSIGQQAFYKCNGLTSITLGNSVNSISETAFNDCVNLRTIINHSELAFTKGTSEFGNIAYYAKKIINLNEGNYEFYKDYLFMSTIDNGVSLQAYLGKEKELTLPENFNGRMYDIGDYAFIDCSDITKVAIPNNVKTLGKGAFENCYNLSSISFSNSIMKIEEYAFYYCTNLENIVIPNSVTSIGKYAFSDCAALKNLTIGNSVTNIGESAFAGCTNIENIVIPNSVTSIERYAFSDCAALKNLTIGKSVTNIGNDAFAGCTGISFIEVNKENSVFDSRNTSNAIILTKLNTIFLGCKNTIIPNTVTCIGKKSFMGCKELKSIAIPASVNRIEASAFSGCKQLSDITILNAETIIEEHAFLETDWLAKQPNGLIYINHILFGYNGTLSGKITIKEGVAYLKYSMFENCEDITEIEIPRSLKRIQDNAFSGCTGIEKVHIADIAAWCNIEFGHSSNPLHQAKHLYMNGKEITDLVIPDGVTSISNNLFSSCESFVNINLGNTIKTIGEKAFYECPNVCKITMGKGVERIENNAFYKCTNLTEINFGQSVSTIENRAFSGCTGLTLIHLPASIKDVKDRAFLRCTNITEIMVDATTPPNIVKGSFDTSLFTKATLKVPVGVLATYQTADVWKDFYCIEEFDPALRLEKISIVPNSLPIYNLQGVQMSDEKENLPTGIYIQGNKKFVIK